MSNLFEKILFIKLNPILSKIGCVLNHQFGFREKHSTVERTHRFTNVIKRTFNERPYCSALFIAVSQAFDRVWRKGIKYKLKLNFIKNVYNLLGSHLSKRKYIIKEGDF